jgi:hypothetical protein
MLELEAEIYIGNLEHSGMSVGYWVDLFGERKHRMIIH